MSKEKIKNTTLKTPLYGNCKVYNPEGEHIFNCGLKKAQWYLKRSLAEVVQHNPLIIKLNFTPAGRGHADDAFYLQERKNVCVSCGTTAHLTKHHVVPLMYRRFFPDELKNHSAHDILPLCYECHEKYEVHAVRFKAELLAELNINTAGANAMLIDTERKKLCLYASAILKHREAIPEQRYEKMYAALCKYFDKDELTSADLEVASKIDYNNRRPDYIPEGKIVVDAIDNIEVFIKRWRKHFIECTAASYMPPYWDIERPIK